MRGSRLFAWVFLAVWGVWLAALSGHLSTFTWLGGGAPDLWCAMFVALGARVSLADCGKLALTLGLARAAVSVDPPAAVLAGALALGAVIWAVRGAVEIDNPVVAAAAAFVVVIANAAWGGFVHAATRAQLVAEEIDQPLPWGAAITTAIVTATLPGLLTRLPGVAPLGRRRAWAVGASHR